MKKSTKVKDLAPKSGKVKGGLIAANDNMTLVRAAKPTPKKKDLPAKTSAIKGRQENRVVLGIPGSTVRRTGGV